ncbi:MAG: acyltransferase [Gammaproteobacteria bacterium]|nr:acyltransferase [Gammaproteobacteria bacterium]NNJ72640.1 acyltransferase family protein [Enterobacterales bacterium]
MASSFNHALHAFRGFAIINITAIHVFAWPAYIIRENGYTVAPIFGIFDWVIGTLLHDSTLYFTFISGILFPIILKGKGYPRFFESKFKYVFLPYLVFTTVFTILSAFSPDSAASASVIEQVLNFIGKLSLNLLTGNALWIYWYIPILLVLYALTPLLEKLPNMRAGKMISAIIIMLPLVASRVWPEVSWTNYVYFLGAYLLGLIVGQNYDKTLELINQYWVLLLIIAVLTTLQFFTLPNPITYGFINLNESFWYVQKIAMAALALLWLEKNIKEVPRWLDLLARYAFALYFLHVAVIMMYFGIFHAMGLSLGDNMTLAISLLVSYPLIMAVCVGLIFIAKTIFGKYSRSIIGA